MVEGVGMVGGGIFITRIWYTIAVYVTVYYNYSQ